MRTAFIAVVVFISALSSAQIPPQPKPPARGQLMTLEEIEREALANNPEIRAAEGRVAVGKARTPIAGALDDPMFMYRNWGTPLEKPWEWNQSQHMFMYQQTLPGRGKRAARTEVAKQQVEEVDAQVEVIRRELGVRVRKAYYDLLRSADEDPKRENVPDFRQVPGRPHEDGKPLPPAGSDALEVPFGGQIGNDGDRFGVPLVRSVLPCPPPLLHRVSKPEDLSPQVGADPGGSERAFARDQVLRKVRPQGAEEADSTHQVREEDGEQENIPWPDTLSFRFHHDG